MNQLDTRLIALLQQNCRMPLQEMADALDISARTVAKRLAALEQNGNIELISVTDIHSAGNDYIVQVGVHVEGRPVIDVAQEIAQLPQIIHINVVLGRFDIELIAIARDSVALGAFLNEELRAITGIAEIAPSLALDVRKFQSNWMAFDDG
jgi:Lrp/AsnC family transcriptional regulator for asnA, asnC and gidA